MEEAVKALEALCEKQGIKRFSSEEIVELLADGETPEWIVEQVLPEGPDEAIAQLQAVLEPLADAVKPEVEVEPEDEAENEVGADAEVGAEEETFNLEDLADMPLPDGVSMDQVKELIESPRGNLMADFGAFCEEKGMAADGDQGEMTAAMQELHEEWLVTPRETLEGKKPGELLEGGRLFPTKVETFRREGPKVGRNDPCPCGSGKKYKKCCGKGG